MLDPNQPIAQIVLDHPETTAVFHRHALDFCCHGTQRLADACAEGHEDLSQILRELDDALADTPRSDEPDPRQLSTPALTHYIVERHHEYLRSALPMVISLATKVRSVHGARQPMLDNLVTTLRELEDVMIPHLDEEEAATFPMLEAGAMDRAAIERLLRGMANEHLAVGELLATIRSATDNYAIPAWACGTYRRLFAELTTMEADIKRHVHLENHVLVPRFVS